jgi:lipoyl synthase
VTDLIDPGAIPVAEPAPSNSQGWQPDPQHPRRRPPWIKVKAPSGETYEEVHRLMRSKTLHTVCEEAQCPNIGECWGRGTATFLMMGDTCTRSCGFCDIKTGRPSPLDWAEPNRIAESVRAMNLRHVVITSVNRDLRDGD